MRIGGIIEHDKNSSVPYYISIPELEIHSQGRTLKEAHKMILDAFGELLSEHTKGKATKKDIEIIPYGKTQFDVVIKKKVKEVTAFIIHRLRAFSDMTQADVVKKMGKSSRRSITVYENASSDATLAKFQEIILAIGYDLKLSFVKTA
jgi:predicted RNase H-like HicB family nuclease